MMNIMATAALDNRYILYTEYLNLLDIFVFSLQLQAIHYKKHTQSTVSSCST